jgi:hypothetical protein
LAGIELTSALARLLSDRELRLRFRADARQVACDLSVSLHDEAILCAIDPAALETQAQALIDKRCGEVARIIPRTWEVLVAERMKLFEEYAEHSWPAGHQRHLLDALGFIRFVIGRGLPHDRIERLRLETRLSRPRYRVSLVMRCGRWRLPALYCSSCTPSGLSERLLHFGPAERTAQLNCWVSESR